jgi:5-methylcytosine-specific restriction endonuclease McrA
MITVARFDPEEIFPYVYFNSRGFNYNGITIKTTSTRLYCFKNNPSCVCCGIKGTIFLLQKHLESEHTPHFNLYAEEEGELILMTKDHIVPVSKGGPTKQSNLQTMCCLCNNLKKNSRLNLEQLSMVKEKYISLTNVMSRHKARILADNMIEEMQNEK